MQAGSYLTATRGLGAPESRICYERAEPLCHSLNRPRLLYVALIGQWRYSLITEKKTVTMQIAKRVYSLAQEQDDSALMIGAHRSLAATLFWLGDFETARQHALRGLEIWRSKDSEALEAIMEAEALVERFEERWWSAELHRLRGVFLAAMGCRGDPN
jgi:hypothetical protein